MAPQGAAHGLYVEMRLNDGKPTNVPFFPHLKTSPFLRRSCCVYALLINPITVTFLL